MNKVALTSLILLAAYLPPFGSPVFSQTSSAICLLPEVTNISLVPKMLKGPSDFDPIYTYDLNGNRTSMIDPTGITTYAYDALNRLTSITNNRGLTTAFTYDSLGRRTSMTHANGVVTTYEYDAASQLTRVTHQRGTTIINSFTYTYDKVGNRLTKTDRNGTYSYTYDTLNRLIQATNPLPSNPIETYTYDPVGNRTNSNQNGASTFNAANQLTEDANFTYQYDNSGNLTRKTSKTGGPLTTHEYDAENKLVRATVNGTIANYKYDGLGRRVEKEVITVGSTVTRYIYDNEDILLELDGSNNITARYTHGLGIDEPLIMEKGGASFFYHADGLGTITDITDIDGNVVQRYTYSSFGKIESQVDTNFIQPYTFTAREFDPEAGLYYSRTRTLDANTGRFNQQDINRGNIQFPDSLNNYVYVRNNPVTFSDPFGLFRFPDVLIGVDSPVGGVQTKIPFASGGEITTVQRGPSVNVPLPFGSVASVRADVDPVSRQAFITGSVSTPVGGFATSANVDNLSVRTTVLGPALNLPVGYGVNFYVRLSFPASDLNFTKRVLDANLLPLACNVPPKQ